MYCDRLRTLTRAYKLAGKNNAMYAEAFDNLSLAKSKISYVNGLAVGLNLLGGIISKQENAWQESVLRRLESEIMQALAVIYPSDGYNVKLSTRVLRGKVHVEGMVQSYYTASIPGDLSDSQGRLFQQVVSFAALVGIMDLLHVNTVYVDEAFSGSSKFNISKINKLLCMYQERGYNIILIAQDTTMSLGMEANTLVLSRSLDNKTTIKQTGGCEHGGY